MAGVDTHALKNIQSMDNAAIFRVRLKEKLQKKLLLIKFYCFSKFNDISYRLINFHGSVQIYKDNLN